MEIALRIGALVLGILGVVFYYRSIVRVMLLNRRERDPVERYARFVEVGITHILAGGLHDYERVQRYQAWVLPIFVLVAVATWFVVVQFAFSFILWALTLETTWLMALSASGSALSTLGFKTPPTLVGEFLAVYEAAIGLAIVVLLFTFVPGYQAAIQARERKVGWIYARTGQHPSCTTLLEALKLAKRLDDTATWEDWESWFRSILETHSISPVLSYVPSVYSGTTWVGASAAVLDTTSLLIAALHPKDTVAARICRETGVTALRLIAMELHRNIPEDAWDRRHVDPRFISGFDQIYNKLTEIGLQVRPDRQACCEMFITLRAEYEASIRHIARATLMPIEEPWILPHPLAPTAPPAPS